MPAPSATNVSPLKDSTTVTTERTCKQRTEALLFIDFHALSPPRSVQNADIVRLDQKKEVIRSLPPEPSVGSQNSSNVVFAHQRGYCQTQLRSGLPFFSMCWMRSTVFLWPQRLTKASRSRSSRYCSETRWGDVNSPPPESTLARWVPTTTS